MGSVAFCFAHKPTTKSLTFHSVRLHRGVTVSRQRCVEYLFVVVKLQNLPFSPLRPVPQTFVADDLLGRLRGRGRVSDHWLSKQKKVVESELEMGVTLQRQTSSDEEGNNIADLESVMLIWFHAVKQS